MCRAEARLPDPTCSRASDGSLLRCVRRRGFERLLRKLLRMKHQPALVVLHWCGPGRGPRGCRPVSGRPLVRPLNTSRWVPSAVSHKLSGTVGAPTRCIRGAHCPSCHAPAPCQRSDCGRQGEGGSLWACRWAPLHFKGSYWNVAEDELDVIAAYYRLQARCAARAAPAPACALALRLVCTRTRGLEAVSC